MPENILKDDYFSYNVFSEKDVAEITDQGITLSNEKTISFADCVKNYALYNDTKGLPIIGERDITDLSFMFYSSPRIVMIKFLKKPWLVELFSTSVYQRFHNLQKQINSFGYITRDLS